MTTKIKSTSLEDNAVTTAKIATDAVTAAKIPANAVGSSELDLTASYTFTGTVSGAGGLTKVSSGDAGTIIASSPLEIALPTSGYGKFHLIFYGYYLSGSPNKFTALRFRTSGGSVRSGGSDYEYNRNTRIEGSAWSGDNGTSNEIIIDYNGAGNAAAEATTTEFEIYNNHLSDVNTSVISKSMGFSDNANHLLQYNGGIVNTAEVNDLVQIFNHGGGSETITHKGYILYGWNN